MRKITIVFLSLIMVVFAANWAISNSKPSEREKRAQVNTRVDNNGYWKKMAKQGLAVLNPVVEVPPAVYTGSNINSRAVRYENSPDVPVTTQSSTQSENSIFIDPNDNLVAVNSNNSTPASGGSVYGANYLYTFDFASTWAGSVNGPNGSNSGDPAVCIGTDGRWYIGYITNASGQGVSYSDDQGGTWTSVVVAPNPGSLADKNHMWIDAKPGSPYENYLYNAWTDFGGSYNNEIVLKRSTDNGETWDIKKHLSGAVNAGSHNQGVNISTGPDGEAYAVWAIYDSWPSDENALAMARSYDGGETWEPAFRIIENIKGIRNSEVPQNMRVNSFPVMAVDASNGPNSGNIYVVWTNRGVPGVNTGNDRDVYMIKSTDEGDTWSDPIRVNQDPIDQGKAHYLPWITCDAENGILSVIFYDNRNTNPTQAEAWVAVSTNAGETWEDFKVSDVAFTPTPIPGLASGYMGDYLAIHSLNGKVYPTWTDNRTGTAMTYVSVFETINVVAPFGLTASTNQETGDTELNWSFNGSTGFDHFNIYRNGEFVISTNDQTFTETLTEFGYYTYEVTAIYSGDLESLPAITETQYGSSTIEITPDSFVAIVEPEGTETQVMKIKNTGVLDLDFSLSPFFGSTGIPNYEKAVGGGDEYINIVRFADMENYSAYDGYLNTKMIARVEDGNSYEAEVIVKNAYEGDQVKIWIDWDQNGEFDEQFVELNDDKEFGIFRGIIDVPEGTKQGATGMRVRLSSSEKLSAYNATEYGETEDYTVMIAAWLSLVPDDGIVAPGDSLLVDVNFDAAGLLVGSYFDDVNLITNDLDNPSYNVDFTMHVTDLAITASADPVDICKGESTQLMATVSGGSGSYTYSWTSNPEGFTSDEANPFAMPDENTVYTVSVDDGSVTVEAFVTVNVHEVPVVDLGGDQVLCGVNEITLDAGNPGDYYMWSTGDTTQSILATGTGVTMFWADVTTEYGCTGYDTVYIDFAENPVVNLGADTAVCGGMTITLDAGNPGSEYLWSNLETSQTINVDTLGYGYGTQEISVQVTNPSGCVGESSVDVEFVDCTSIDEIENIELNVYPNPTNGVFNVLASSNVNDPVDIKVTDQSGKVVYEANQIRISNDNKLTIDLSGYSDGIYTVSVILDGASTSSRVILRK